MVASRSVAGAVIVVVMHVLMRDQRARSFLAETPSGAPDVLDAGVPAAPDRAGLTGG
ncbi:MAG: hypothetical protein HY264_04925 [Chloroflexi bacterium]|nr:hypothetical protein [Chloroflexota bacterium]